MSSQQNFFCMPEELALFTDFFHRRKVSFLPIEQDEANVRPQEQLDVEERRALHKIGLVFADFVGNVSYQWKEWNGKYELNVRESWVIEFDLGGFYPSTPNILHRSRFYAVNDYFTRADVPVTKSEEFKKWTRSFYRAFKKEFLRTTDEPKWLTFTDGCLAWIKTNNAVMEGGALTMKAGV
jgi:hypothetical protein